MKHSIKLIIILFLFYILVSQVLVSLGDFSVSSSDGKIITAESCKAPQTQEEFIYFGNRNCLNVIYSESMVSKSSNVRQYQSSYDVEFPHEITILFREEPKNNEFKCLLNKHLVKDVLVVTKT